MNSTTGLINIEVPGIYQIKAENDKYLIFQYKMHLNLLD